MTHTLALHLDRPSADAQRLLACARVIYVAEGAATVDGAPLEANGAWHGTGEVEVPNVVGKSQSEAQTIIAAANLQVETKFKATNEVPEGQVISQSPKDGTVDIGGTIKITVAQKAAPTLTPTTVTPTPSPSPTPSESPTTNSLPTPPPTP